MVSKLKCIDLTTVDMSFRSGHLRPGGDNPAAVRLDANNRYLTLNNQPWLSEMGEFHFSRYPWSIWRDELPKIRAGGVYPGNLHIMSS